MQSEVAEILALESIMQKIVHYPEQPAAIRTDLAAIFVSLELSRSAWLITLLSPGAGEKMSKHAVKGSDIAGLLTRFAALKERAGGRTGKDFRSSSSRRRVWMASGSIGLWRKRASRATCSI